MPGAESGRVAIVIDLSKEIAKNLLMGVPAIRKRRLARPRTATDFSTSDEFLRTYAFSGLNLLLEHTGGITEKSVCEIGPGDYLTSGLAILAAGANRYCVMDRFPGNYAGPAAKKWYSEIERNWSRFYPSIPWPAQLATADFPESYHDRVEILRGSVETAAPTRKFDILCSFQVAEHVADIDAFATMHNRVLDEKGVGVHRVDFGPHDCWTGYDDPCVFLRFSDSTWDLSGSNRGVPNRRRHHEFLEAFERCGLDAEVLYTDHFDKASIEFDKLDSRFKEMPIDSLLVRTAIYRISKR